MREFLIELQGEVESRRRPRRPTPCNLRSRLAVERRIHLDRIEMLRVEPKLVELIRSGALRARLRIEEAVPRPLARWVIPPRRPHPYVSHDGHLTIRDQGSGIRDQGSGIRDRGSGTTTDP